MFSRPAPMSEQGASPRETKSRVWNTMLKTNNAATTSGVVNDNHLSSELQCPASGVNTTISRMSADDGSHHYGWAVALSVAIMAVAVAVVFMRRKFIGLHRKKDEVGALSPAANDEERILRKPAKSKPIKWPRSISAGADVSQEWSEFVNERLKELKSSQAADESKLALGIVDFMDEIKESEAGASSAERDLSASLRHELLDILSSRGFEIIDSEVWNPDLQRAVATVRKPDATETVILDKGSSGLSRNGKIIRKQEVKIEMKGN